MEPLEILKFCPILKQTPWGGSNIVPFKGVDHPLDHVGESWEISSVPSDVSLVRNGRYKGQSLTEIIHRFGGRLVGQRIYASNGDRFPLLVKFIDACQDLSIQVHPNDEVARRQGYANGKTEMWYIVDAQPGAFLLSGFKQRITEDDFERKACDGSICDVICKHPVTPGDCFFIPAGQVHAICSGIFLIEIQQTSDVTYRIYDYQRKGLDGHLRQLHITEAREAINFRPGENAPASYSREENQRNEMVHCSYFTTSSFSLSRPCLLDLSQQDSFSLLIAYEGQASLEHEDERVSFSAGETVLIPAEYASLNICPASANFKFLEVHI